MAPCRVRKWGAQSNIWMSSSCIRQEPLPARGLGLSTGRWCWGSLCPRGFFPAPAAQRAPRDANASQAATCPCCLIFLLVWKFRHGNLGRSEPFAVQTSQSVTHARACRRAGRRTSMLLCISWRASFASSLCQPAPRCPSARSCTCLPGAQGRCLFSAGSASSRRQVPPRKNPRVLPRGSAGPPRQEDSVFPRRAASSIFTVSLRSAAAGRAHGRCSSCSPGERQQIQPGCRDSGNRETGTNTAPPRCCTKDPRGPGPRRPLHPDKLRLRSSCWDRPRGQRVPDKCAINAATAA